jgi:hypothetical protein
LFWILEASWTRNFATLVSEDSLTENVQVKLVDDLPKLSKLPQSALSKDYRGAVRKLGDIIESRATPKQVDGLGATGRMLAELVDQWAQKINVPIGNFAGNSAAALLDHIIFKEVGRVVVLYDQAMSVIRVPTAEGDIIARHDKTLHGLLAGLPERLTNAIEEAVRPRLEKHIRDSHEYSHNSLANILAEHNQSLVYKFGNLSLPPGRPPPEPAEIERLGAEAVEAFEDAARRAHGFPPELALRDEIASSWSGVLASFKAKIDEVRSRLCLCACCVFVFVLVRACV